MNNKFLLAATLCTAFTLTASAQEKVIATATTEATPSITLTDLAHQKEFLNNEAQIKTLSLENDKAAAKKLEQEKKIAAKEQKAALKEQKRQAKEHKAELKKQQNIIKSQAKLDKANDKLAKAKAKLNKEQAKFTLKQAGGKLTAMAEIKGKSNLLKLETKVKELEYEVKKQTLNYEALTK